MAAWRSTPSSPCSRSCASGFSLVELLVAMTVVLAVAAGAMSVVESSRRTYQTDRARTTVNQNLRIGMDMLAIDAREAGERLPGDVAAIEIVDGGGGPDQVVFRRNMLDAVLPLCKDIKGGSAADSVFVGKKGPKPPPGCAPVADSDGDGWPDNLQEWREYRIGVGGIATAYVHDPITGAGEFFQYDAEDNSTFHVHKSNPGNWLNDFDVDHGSRVYILEERRFVVQSDLLQMVINGNTAAPMNLVSSITDLQARAVLGDGTIVTSLTAADDWTDVVAVEVTLFGQSTFQGRTSSRSVTTRLFPRNIMSL